MSFQKPELATKKHFSLTHSTSHTTRSKADGTLFDKIDLVTVQADETCDYGNVSCTFYMLNTYFPAELEFLRNTILLRL